MVGPPNNEKNDILAPPLRDKILLVVLIRGMELEGVGRGSEDAAVTEDEVDTSLVVVTVVSFLLVLIVRSMALVGAQWEPTNSREQTLCSPVGMLML